MTIGAPRDSGASESLVSAKCVKNSRTKAANDGGTWSTPARELKTQQKVKAQFTSPELQDRRLIEWNPHTAEDMGAHDMIIGQDTLSFLKMDIKFSKQPQSIGLCAVSCEDLMIFISGPSLDISQQSLLQLKNRTNSLLG